MLVLGVDPGTAITGYGLVEDTDGELRVVDFGAITTPADQPLARRLQTIYQELSAILEKHRPTEAVVEKLFFSQNVRTAMSVGQARGVTLLALANAGLSIHEYTPLEVKQAVVGYGRASKHQIQEMIRMLLALEAAPQPDDAADALAVAICHIHSAHLTGLIEAQT